MSIKYRPEVDGLRAVSVVAILIYHAEFLWSGHNVVPGAFLAVEIFFVISGFLITSIILRELAESGSFSIKNFYDRRLRRLLPALLVILSVTAVAAWFILLPSQMVDFAKSLVASLFFVSNFYWDLSLQEYGAESGQLKPLLHTWTLAVEEQFYIVFPFMLVAFHKWFRSYIVWLLLVIMLASLCFAQWHTGVNPHTSFYMLSSRFWELMAGAILALTIHKLPAYDSNTPIKSIMSAVGLFIVLSSFFLFSFKTSHHPGFMTTYTVFGTVLIIAFSGGNDPVTRLLASRPFVTIGMMSYSIYLWHYPIFAFARNTYTNITPYDKLGWFALTFILSIFSYQYIEKPFRNRRTISTRQVLTLVPSLAAMLIVACVYVVKEDGVQGRFTDRQLLYGVNEFDNSVLAERTWENLNKLASQHGLGPSKPNEPSEFESKVLWFSDNPDHSKVLIVGPSISRDMFNAFYENRDKFPETEFARFGMHGLVKPEQVDALFSSPNLQAADTVLLNFLLIDKDLTKFTELVERLTATGKHVAIVSNPQVFNLRNSKGPFDWYLMDNEGKDVKKLDFDRVYFAERVAFGADVDPMLQQLAEKFDLQYLNLRNLVCDPVEERCVGVTPDGYKTFYDSVHWTLQGARYFGARIATLGWTKR